MQLNGFVHALRCAIYPLDAYLQMGLFGPTFFIPRELWQYDSLGLYVRSFHTICDRVYLPAGGLIRSPLLPLHTRPVGRELAEIIMWPAPGPTTHTLPAGHGLAEGSLRFALEPELDWAPLLMCVCSVQLVFVA